MSSSVTGGVAARHADTRLEELKRRLAIEVAQVVGVTRDDRVSVLSGHEYDRRSFLPMPSLDVKAHRAQQ